MIVMAVKPHQESINYIGTFVWCMCVSYCGLNKITKLYECPIPRCNMAITIIELGSTGIYFIKVDAKQGYHQVAVRACDVEKLAFFGPDNKTYGFTVMPFGLVNAPPIYIFMMGVFKMEWDSLFIEVMTRYATSNTFLCGKKVIVTEVMLSLDGAKNTSGSKSIIDNILIWSNNKEAVLFYFDCVCRVF